jgi:hypothetical protein
MGDIRVADVRLRWYLALLLPCFVGHLLQIISEDEPWAEWAWENALVNAGWHQLLPDWVPWAVAAALGVSIVGLAGAVARRQRERSAFLILAALYLAHYVTYPWRIRNHMTTMLGSLGVVAIVWLMARARGALREGHTHARRVDGVAVRGLGIVIATQYFFAGLHKVNGGFLDPSIEGGSAAISGLTEFWIHGDLGSVPPVWARYAATYGTVVIEMGAPLVALLIPRVAPAAIAVLMAFHFPQIAVMNVADYPMIASTSYVGLLSLHDAHRIARQLSPTRWTVVGSCLGIAAQLWFMPYWGALMVFGMFVMGLWGWVLGAMAHAQWVLRRRNLSAVQLEAARRPGAVPSSAPRSSPTD